MGNTIFSSRRQAVSLVNQATVKFSSTPLLVLLGMALALLVYFTDASG